jgi:hypothetical protein
MRRTIIAITAALATLSSAQAAVQTVEADNGAVYRILGIHVQATKFQGISQTYVTTEVADDSNEMTYLTFDCNGSFSLETASGSHSGWRHIPARSVAGRIAQIACGVKGYQ